MTETLSKIEYTSTLAWSNTCTQSVVFPIKPDKQNTQQTVYNSDIGGFSAGYIISLYTDRYSIYSEIL